MPRRTSAAASKGTGSTKGPVLTFDSDRHEYRLDGLRVPGTSEVLAAAGILDKAKMEEIPQEYRIRGLAVHEWTEALDLHQLPHDVRIPAVVAPYVDAWRAFLRDARPEILAVEELVCDRLRRFATRVDRRVRMNGAEWVLNLKSGGHYPHYQYQSALEALCYRVGLRRACVYLSKDGRYRLQEWTDPRDFRVAESAIRKYYAARTAAERGL